MFVGQTAPDLYHQDVTGAGAFRLRFGLSQLAKQFVLHGRHSCDIVKELVCQGEAVVIVANTTHILYGAGVVYGLQLLPDPAQAGVQAVPGGDIIAVSNQFIKLFMGIHRPGLEASRYSFHFASSPIASEGELAIRIKTP